MRETFIRTLTELARIDNRIYLLTADMGYGLVNPFADKFPDRFINVGVAEQNMIGVATGLALSGKVVFCYSIATFPTLRCLDQIRNDGCAHKANVTIVAGGTGLTYGELGSTHHAIQDIACMRSLSDMTVIAPGDVIEVELATKAIMKRGGPNYMRLGRFEDTDIKGSRKFTIGKVRELPLVGNDAIIIATGSMLNTAINASMELAPDYLVNVLSCHTIKPIDDVAILVATKETKVIITVEEHSIIGGLGSAVAEVLTDNHLDCKLKRMGIPDEAMNRAFSWEQLREIYHLTVDGIVAEVKKLHEKATS